MEKEANKPLIYRTNHWVAFAFVFVFFSFFKPSKFPLSKLQYACWNLFTSFGCTTVLIFWVLNVALIKHMYSDGSGSGFRPSRGAGFVRPSYLFIVKTTDPWLLALRNIRVSSLRKTSFSRSTILAYGPAGPATNPLQSVLPMLPTRTQNLFTHLQQCTKFQGVIKNTVKYEVQMTKC